MKLRTVPLALAALALAGCETYAPRPLAMGPELAPSVADLRLAPKGWPNAPGAVDPRRPLALGEIALLAVENNPDLRAARAAEGVAAAQVIEAGLLPNPQFSGQLGFVTGGAGTATAWTAGLAQDVKALVTLSATSRAAGFEARKVSADLLWQEWQVIAKARALYIDTVEVEKLRLLVAGERSLFADRYARSKRAADEGNLTLSAAAADFAALSGVETQLADLERQAETRRHDLNALLGLSPNVTLALDPDIALPSLDRVRVERMLGKIAARRPDSVALRLGYAAQEENVRAAILAQFPTLIIGGVGGSDTTSVASLGPSITIDLPIFDRNQGKIAIARATRFQLHEEYTKRLTAASGEILALLDEQNLLERQLAAAQARLPEAENAARHAEAAFRAGNIDERGYVDLAATALSERQTIVTLQQALFERRAAMATLLGAGLPETPSDFAAMMPETKR